MALVGHAGSSVPMEPSQRRRSKVDRCRNSHAIAELPNVAGVSGNAIWSCTFRVAHQGSLVDA